MDPDEINDGLTDSEREVLAGLDDDEDDLGALKEIADNDGDEGDEGADEGQAGGGNDAPADATAAAAATTPSDAGAADAGAADAPADAPADIEPKSGAEPIYKAEAPADVDAKLKEIQQARRKARKDYEEGALDEEQYDAKLDELDQQRDTINRAITRAEVSAEITEQQLANSYTKTVNTFMVDMKRAGIDYRDPKNAEQAKYLNARVVALAQTEHEQNPESWRQLLEEAHMLTAKRFGITTAPPVAPTGQPKGDPAPKKAAPADRKPDLSGIPPTVGRGPGAANAGVAPDEFAHLDSLSGIALERAMANMTPEQLDRYLP